MSHTSPEDVLADVLPAWIGQYERVSFGTPGDLYTHPSAGVVVSPPDSLAKNWALQASTIWVAAIFLADHIAELRLSGKQSGYRIIELGAAAGLPGIAIAKAAPHVEVWLSDYPDPLVLQRLDENIVRNHVEGNCRTAGHAWGTKGLMRATAEPNTADTQIPFPDDGFDLVIAADTLWNVEMHAPLCDSIRYLLPSLGRNAERRAILVAGFHTGRYTIQKFLDGISLHGLNIHELRERNISTSEERPWSVYRHEEDEGSLRQWVVWIVLCLDPDIS